MKYIVKCNGCGSMNLETIDIVFSKDTNEGRYEDGFKCAVCGNEMTLDEIDFESEKTNK